LIRKQNQGSTKSRKSDWDTDEEEKLLNAVETHGENNWREVANDVEGKQSLDCRQKYF